MSDSAVPINPAVVELYRGRIGESARVVWSLTDERSNLASMFPAVRALGNALDDLADRAPPRREDHEAVLRQARDLLTDPTMDHATLARQELTRVIEGLSALWWEFFSHPSGLAPSGPGPDPFLRLVRSLKCYYETMAAWVGSDHPIPADRVPPPLRKLLDELQAIEGVASEGCSEQWAEASQGLSGIDEIVGLLESADHVEYDRVGPGPGGPASHSGPLFLYLPRDSHLTIQVLKP